MILALFMLQSLFAQENAREVLHGKIISEAMGVEGVTVKNLALSKFAVADEHGEFLILAKANDTLVFSSQSFQSKKMVLTKADFLVRQLIVKLDLYVNALEEVIIDPHSLSGNLEMDQKNIKITELKPIDTRMATNTYFEDDNQSSPDNKLMPGYVDMTYAMDLKAIGRKFFRLVKPKKKDQKAVFISREIFPVAARKKFTENFFTDILKLKPDEIGAFLTFCESDPQAHPLLEARREFELIDFLIAKSKVYKLGQKP